MKTLAVIPLLVAAVQGAALQKRLTGGTEIYVDSATSFCIFLPPDQGAIVSAEEYEGQAFCMGNAASVNANPIPGGMILSANYLAQDSYVQVTGQFDPTVYGMQLTDGGGQFDPYAPQGSSCQSNAAFINIIEPNTGLYCVRCCANASSTATGGPCNRGRSQDGCEAVIPGDYSGPSTMIFPSASSTTSSSTVSSTDSSSSTSSPSASDSANVTGAAQFTTTGASAPILPSFSLASNAIASSVNFTSAVVNNSASATFSSASAATPTSGASSMAVAATTLVMAVVGAVFHMV
ncbi:hypothetical protein BZG36_00751 [Bifiguratus adelaidae]|uniref:Uncharacterized protein n=1 Tax=Bifiguratus adelaidae TaxID=1938954 RepID=A0A261Y6Z1_9FUNG|nr:hypothetical protein BZG36_00751 [Bifiguratus adelaidae]